MLKVGVSNKTKTYVNCIEWSERTGGIGRGARWKSVKLQCI